MPATDIGQLAERLQASDPADAHEQREIFEHIRTLRSAFDGPLDPESQRCLEAAGMLVAYLARMGAMAGADVRVIAVRLLRSAAEAERAAEGSTPRTASASPPPIAATHAGIHRIISSVPQPMVPTPAPTPVPAEPRSATDLMGEMMLGQLLLQRGHILEEHIHQAMKVQRVSPIRIGDIFVKIGACSRTQVEDALRHQASLRRLRGNLGETAPAERADTRGTGLKLVGEAMLGEILIERNVITRRQLERALEVQRQTGSRIGEALVKLGATTLDQIEAALRVQGRDRRFGTNTTESPGRGEKKR